jgi:hypothetical protein
MERHHFVIEYLINRKFSFIMNLIDFMREKDFRGPPTITAH